MLVSNFYKSKFESLKQVESTKMISSKPSVRKKNTQSNQTEKRAKLDITDSSNSSQPLTSMSLTTSDIFNCDLSKEKNIILTAIKRWLKTIDFKCSNFPLTLDEINSSQIEVSVSVNSSYDNDGEGNNSDNDLIAHVTCIICCKNIKIIKISKSVQQNSRWIYSNYHRHVTTHSNYSGKQKIKKNNILTDYFRASTSSSRNSNNSEITYDVDKSDFQVTRIINRTDDTCNIKTPINIKSSKIVERNEKIKTKWQSKTYSRTERNRRARQNSLLLEHNVHGLRQPFITFFSPLLNEVEKIILENQDLKEI